MAVDRLRVVSVAELDQLDSLVFRDARIHKSCDAVDMFLHTWATPAGSELQPVLSEGALSHANLCLRFVFFCFFLCFFSASAWHRKPLQVYSSVVYTPSHAKTSSHSHPQKQSLGLRHNKALACIPPARSWLLLRVMTSRAREGCQPVRQTVLFLILLLQKMGPLGTFLVASRKHRPHHSIHLYTPRPDYISQRPLLIHTTHKNKALASDTKNP